MLKRICRSKKVEIGGDQRKLHTEELHALHQIFLAQRQGVPIFLSPFSQISR
jgi:hypothetical protein